MFSTGNQLLLAAGLFALAATVISVWQIVQHLRNLHNLPVQSKIIGITWMIPIYSCDSFLSLWVPSIANYVNMLRDCYEAYVLYLFLSLMLSYLGCQEDDYQVVTYLEKQPIKQRPFPLSVICPGDLPRGKAFLRYCKFGTLQYCVVRPSTTLAAIILQMMGLYHEGEFSWSYGYMYIMLLINLSVAYAFVALASFYSELKSKLYPFAPVGKFLCIKFIIFFAFWQGIIITGLVYFDVIGSIDGIPTDSTSNGLQEFLICVEMFIAAVAFTYNFSHTSFVMEAAQSAGLHDLFSADIYSKSHHAVQHNPLRPKNSRSRNSSVPINQRVSTASSDGNHNSYSSNGIQFGVSSGSGDSGEIVGNMPMHRVQQVPLARSGAVKQSLLVGVGGRLLGREKTGYQLVQMSDNDSCSGESKAATAVAVATEASARSQHSDKQARAARKQHQQRTTATSSSNQNIMETHFAMNTAIRDFNETMPVIVLPSGFTMQQGKVVLSDPAARLRQMFDGPVTATDDDDDDDDDDQESDGDIEQPVDADVLFYSRKH